MILFINRDSRGLDIFILNTYILDKLFFQDIYLKLSIAKPMAMEESEVLARFLCNLTAHKKSLATETFLILRLLGSWSIIFFNEGSSAAKY